VWIRPCCCGPLERPWCFTRIVVRHRGPPKADRRPLGEPWCYRARHDCGNDYPRNFLTLRCAGGSEKTGVAPDGMSVCPPNVVPSSAPSLLLPRQASPVTPGVPQGAGNFSGSRGAARNGPTGGFWWRNEQRGTSPNRSWTKTFPVYLCPPCLLSLLSTPVLYYLPRLWLLWFPSTGSLSSQD
jgi:hypothetical protein